jgi:hypothetical protein
MDYSGRSDWSARHARATITILRSSTPDTVLHQIRNYIRLHHSFIEKLLPHVGSNDTDSDTTKCYKWPGGTFIVNYFKLLTILKSFHLRFTSFLCSKLQ